MAEEKKLRCPGCGNGLEDAYAEANYGRVLLLDQCAGCGGVWFDKWELYFVKEHSLEALHAIDLKTFSAPNPESKGNNHCPRCERELKDFTDPMLPPDASIKRCDACSGLWLNRGELSKYANHKKKIRGSISQMPPAAKIETLRHLQDELKIGDIATPTTTELAMKLENDTPVTTKEVAKDMGFLILQSLLRLVFKF
ncbi:MAG: zf-TFIIB domain-containing protein [Deltaproteobacteria bacterium]|nr:zf-TFIIB domain-containing protein [Deltaproteobacteria bacterium]